MEAVSGSVDIYDNSVPILPDIHWVGFYDNQADIHCNAYLLIDGDEAVLIDSGSVPHFSVVMRKVINLIDPEQISVIIASHQDPDVTGNIAVVEDLIGRDDLKIAAHTSTVSMIRYYGVKSDFYPVDENSFRLELKSGRILEFIHTPYLHSFGSITTLDTKTQSMFSSDLFSALPERWELFAGENYFESMDKFHQLYMPSGAILSNCVSGFEKMDIARILPQHGSVLEGDNVEKAIMRLQSLPCGTDLL